jgi:hypothetical protein
VYTKALFQWRKALSTSRDEKTLYDFARHGLPRLESLNRKLVTERFQFRPGLAKTYTFNGKIRTLYIYPWEEKIVDLLLYRVLSANLHKIFSPSSYAYRYQSYGVDLCQTRISKFIAMHPKPLFLFKRDIANYFDSIDHALLRKQLEAFIDPGDYLWQLLMERVQFQYEVAGSLTSAARGVPFGTPIACFFANLHLTELDHWLTQQTHLTYFRYADDLLGMSADSETIERAAAGCDRWLSALHLMAKRSHCVESALSETPLLHHSFVWLTKFRHLGLEFRANGLTRLSRDKTRKIQNIFRYAFRRKASRLRRLNTPQQRARLAVDIARSTLCDSIRPVAIIDYYLKHVKDEAQLRLIDRWLAEEVLSIAFKNGHRKGNFRRLSFEQLRAMGLPSLLHRSRLIRHGQIQTSFFQWKEHQRTKRTRGGWRQAHRAFSPGLAAAVNAAS